MINHLQIRNVSWSDSAKAESYRELLRLLDTPKFLKSEISALEGTKICKSRNE